MELEIGKREREEEKKTEIEIGMEVGGVLVRYLLPLSVA